MSRWKEQNAAGSEARESMNRFLEEMAKSGELRPPKHVLVPLTDFRDASLISKLNAM